MTNIGSHDAPKKAPESTTNSPEGIKKLFTELRNNNQINTEMKALIKESLVDEKTAKYKEDLKKIYFAFYSSSEGKATEHQKKAF
ncbi:MAG: hypothetical protein LBU27_02210 [Candidatus Peribacteria bacterium]|nr:hypothetical protein [Candidatus Peribacteria bacterium]